MPTQSQDIQTLKTDVALIKQEMKQSNRTLNSMSIKMDNFAYVSQKDYAEDRLVDEDKDKKRDEKIAALEAKVNLGGLDTVNKVFSGVGKIIVAALVFGLVALIVWSILRVNPAIQGVTELQGIII